MAVKMTDTLAVGAVDGKWPERSEEQEVHTDTYTEMRKRGCQSCPVCFTFQTNVFLFCRGDGGKEGCSYIRTDANRRNNKNQTLSAHQVSQDGPQGTSHGQTTRNTFSVHNFGLHTKRSCSCSLLIFASWRQAWKEFGSDYKDSKGFFFLAMPRRTLLVTK